MDLKLYIRNLCKAFLPCVNDVVHILGACVELYERWGHNEVRDAIGILLLLLVLQNGSPALISDLASQGVWQPQAEMLFEICVVDTEAQSYH